MPAAADIHRAMNLTTKEKTMLNNLLYRGLPTSLLFAVLAFVQYHAIRAFA